MAAAAVLVTVIANAVGMWFVTDGNVVVGLVVILAAVLLLISAMVAAMERR
jgi:hypothetical protein